MLHHCFHALNSFSLQKQVKVLPIHKLSSEYNRKDYGTISILSKLPKIKTEAYRGTFESSNVFKSFPVLFRKFHSTSNNRVAPLLFFLTYYSRFVKAPFLAHRSSLCMLMSSLTLLMTMPL